MANHSKINTGLITLNLLSVAGLAWFTQQEITEDRKSREMVNDIRANVAALQEKVTGMDGRFRAFVLTSQLDYELEKRDREILELKKQIELLNRRTATPPHPAAAKP